MGNRNQRLDNLTSPRLKKALVTGLALILMYTSGCANQEYRPKHKNTNYPIYRDPFDQRELDRKSGRYEQFPPIEIKI